MSSNNIYIQFVKANYPRVKKANPNLKQTDLMKKIAEEYRKSRGQHGSGFFDTVKNIAGLVKEGVKTARDRIFFPANRLSAPSQKVFNETKDAIINSITVNRVPLDSMVNKALNFLSLGAFNKVKKELGYDDMFHLSAILRTSKGDILIEKNERINISRKLPKSGEQVQVSGTNKTFDEFLDKGRKDMGDHYFFQYNAFENNCQDFLIGLLRANGILSTEASAFIKQDAVALLKKMPSYLSTIAQGATDAAGRIKQAVGLGKKKPRKRAPPKQIAKRK
jgi:hypothetical protein